MTHRRHYLWHVVSIASLVTLIPTAADICSAGKPAGPGGLPARTLVLDGSPVHNAGNLRVHASNWGEIGSRPGTALPFQNAPSAEWPAGSLVEYLWAGGIWVGALVSGVPAVSTSSYEYEFRPSSDVRDIVYYAAYGALHGNRRPAANADDDIDGSIDEDALDGFDNDLDGAVDEDFAGISTQMLSRRFRDDDPSAIAIYPNHVPMHLRVHEESYQFSDPDFDDFVGFTFRITNDGIDPLEDVYVGVFCDGDVGHRNQPNYWTDDATAFLNDLVVDHSPHPSQAYDFPYWYDLDGDAGVAPGYCGIVVLDHPVDPTGADAPMAVGVSSYATFSGSQSFEEGGDPTNDFERYEVMSSQLIEGPATGGDHRSLIAVGPFAALAPGETITFSFALVVTPRDDFTHVARAATAYHGLWFDMDANPATGVGGKEHQEHWFLPGDNPTSVAGPAVPFVLGQNVPNPFSALTTIPVVLAADADVDLAVYDVAGRRVATVASGARARGGHEFAWDGTDDAGKRVSNGVYFYRLRAGNQVLTRKLLVVR